MTYANVLNTYTDAIHIQLNYILWCIFPLVLRLEKRANIINGPFWVVVSIQLCEILISLQFMSASWRKSPAYTRASNAHFQSDVPFNRDMGENKYLT